MHRKLRSIGITLPLPPATTSNGAQPAAVLTRPSPPVNANGEGANSSEVSATPQGTQPPVAPTSLTANSGKKKVTLHWTQSISPNVAQNKIYRSTVNGGPYMVIATVTASSQYNNTGLTSGTTYYYVVTAVNGSGQESPFSNQASGTPR